MEEHGDSLVRDWKSWRIGFACAAAISLVAAVAVWIAPDVLSKPRLFYRSCHGATVTGVMTLDTVVQAQVMITDNQTRRWEYEWNGHSDRDATTVPERDEGPAGFTSQFGDVDDGTRFTLYLRPENTKDWCALDMHVSWYP